MNQTEFTRESRGLSQCDLILNRLKQSPGQWVEMPELWRASGAFAVHSRICDLRKRGNNIEQRSERSAAITKSYYRICEQQV